MLRLALIATLVANVVLGAVWWQRRAPSATEPPPAPTASVPAPSTAPAPESATAQIIAGADIGPYLTDPALSDPDLIARLRAAGVPIEVIREIIRQRVHARYADRWSALVEEARRTPYWKPSRGMPAELRRRLQSLAREERAERIALLGDEAVAPNETGSYEDTSTLTFLAPAKRQQLGQLLSDFTDLQRDVMVESMGIFTPDDREILTFLNAEFTQELATLLSPEELAEFETRAGSAATDLQGRIQHFAASEEEYLRLFELYRETMTAPVTLFPGPGLTPSDQEAREKAWRTVVDRFATELPPERAALWADTMDPQYSMADYFVRQQGLDTAVTLGLVRLSRELDAGQRTLFQGDNLTETQRNLDLATLVNRTEQELARLLPSAEARTAWSTSMQGRRFEMLKRRLNRPRP